MISFGATSIPDICQQYYLNPTFRKHKFSLYADDMLIYKPISTSSNYRELQEDINIIFQWSVENLLTFNAAKCIYTYPTMMLNDQTLEIVQYKYLGLLDSSNLSWTPHIRLICNKARRILGRIYRKFSLNTDCSVTLVHETTLSIFKVENNLFI